MDEEVVEFLHVNRLIIDFVYVAAAAVLLYDYLLTINLEIELFWFSPWSYTKILFLLTRYTPFVHVPIILCNQLLPGISPEVCISAYSVVMWIMLISIVCSETVLAIRTWAVWQRNKKVGWMLAISIVSVVIAKCIITHMISKTVELLQHPEGPPFGGCFMFYRNKIVSADWICLCVIDIAFLVLVVISACKASGKEGSSELLSVVYRDGILFYVYIICLNIASVMLIYTLPNNFVPLLGGMEVVCYSVFTGRIMLNIRKVGRQRDGETTAELHTGYQETLTIPNLTSFSLPLEQLEYLGHFKKAGELPFWIEEIPLRFV